MSDQEINYKLALAIGYAHQQVRSMSDGSMIVMHTPGMWHKFSYMDWRVVGPIAQRYDCFPFCAGGGWCNFPNGVIRLSSRHNRTPQEAIAMAVIAAHEAGVLE